MASLSSGNTLSLQGLIASGEFSAVFLAHRSKDTELTVVKCFSRERSSADEHAERRVQSEKFALSLISQISHPFVVQFRYVHYDNDQLFLGMEHVGGCDAFTLLQNKGSLSPDWTRIYAAEICLALGHVHSFDIVFCDLKPENVLIGLDGHLKLVDFSSALKLYGRRGAVPPPARLISLSGTPEYMSPEILLGAPTCRVSDWWSFACFVCELLTGSSPFVEADQDIQGLVNRIIHGPIDIPQHPHTGAEELNFLEALLVRDPRDRLGAHPLGHQAVLLHEWFHGMSAELLLQKQLPAPWLPHLNGPLPEAEGTMNIMHTGDASATNAMASGHAQGARLHSADEAIEAQLAARLAPSPAVPAGWGEWVDVRISSAPTYALAPNAPSPAPPPPAPPVADLEMRDADDGAASSHDEDPTRAMADVSVGSALVSDGLQSLDVAQPSR